MKCLVLGARRYSFDGEGGGKVEGVTLHYVTHDQEAGQDQKGTIPLQVSAPLSVFHELQAVPGSYDVDFRQRPGRGGKPTLMVAGVSYGGPISLGDAENGSTE